MKILREIIKEYTSWQKIRDTERKAQVLDRLQRIIDSHEELEDEQIVSLIGSRYPHLFYDIGPHKLQKLIKKMR